MNVLKKENISIYQDADNWQQAITYSLKPLEDQGYVDDRYAKAIISNVERLGPYIVIAPNIALPHARPEEGVISTQLSITLFQNPISFNEQTAAKLFIALAAADNSSHLDALVAITKILQDEKIVDAILRSRDVTVLSSYFSVLGGD